MRVFLDTNILLDIIEPRQQFVAASQEAIQRCDILGFDIFVAVHGLATLFYLTERKSGAAKALASIAQILSFAEAAPLGDSEARKALTLGIADFEDALQVAAASACAADFLVTRDASGFTGSPVPQLSPDEFLRRFPVPSGT